MGFLFMESPWYCLQLDEPVSRTDSIEKMTDIRDMNRNFAQFARKAGIEDRVMSQLFFSGHFVTEI